MYLIEPKNEMDFYTRVFLKAVDDKKLVATMIRRGDLVLLLVSITVLSKLIK